MANINVNKGDNKMQKNIEVILDEQHLLSLFAKDDLYKPYRFQQGICIVIPYSAYVSFVRICLRNNLSVFRLGLHKYREALQNENLMQRLYLLDISDVILHELYLSCAENKYCIMVQHLFNTADDLVKYDDCAALFDEMPEDCKQKSLDLFVKEIAEYSNISDISKYKQSILDYGMYLRTLSFCKEAKIFNIVGG